MVFLLLGWIGSDTESVSSRERPSLRIKPVATVMRPAAIPMPAAPAGQTGCPNHRRFDVLLENPKNAAYGNRNRFIISGKRLMIWRNEKVTWPSRRKTGKHRIRIFRGLPQQIRLVPPPLPSGRSREVQRRGCTYGSESGGDALFRCVHIALR